MKYYYSHKFNEWLVSSKNWNVDDKSDWWNDTLIILPCVSSARGPEYRYRHELPWHYRRIKDVPAIVRKIATAWEAQ